MSARRPARSGTCPAPPWYWTKLSARLPGPAGPGITIPASLRPADGRFGCGPSKIRPEQLAALAELHARRPDRVLATNVEFWAAIMLDFAEVPSHMFTSMFACARTAGWAAHILEQKQTGRLVRPSARYVGPKARPVRDVPGAADVLDKNV